MSKITFIQIEGSWKYQSSRNDGSLERSNAKMIAALKTWRDINGDGSAEAGFSLFHFFHPLVPPFNASPAPYLLYHCLINNGASAAHGTKAIKAYRRGHACSRTLGPRGQATAELP